MSRVRVPRKSLGISLIEQNILRVGSRATTRQTCQLTYLSTDVPGFQLQNPLAAVLTAYTILENVHDKKLPGLEIASHQRNRKKQQAKSVDMQKRNFIISSKLL
jgi:hypothetical protein